jgi:hypothetical protein
MTFFKRLLEWGFKGNTWVWFHILAGAVGAKVANVWLNGWWAVLIVLLGAIVWEIYEYNICDIEKVYGSRIRWFYDSLGDVLGAVVAALIVVA